MQAYLRACAFITCLHALCDAGPHFLAWVCVQPRWLAECALTMTRGYTQGEGDSLREELAAHIPAGDTIEGVLRSPEFFHVRVSVVRAFACLVWRVC